ncbi:MAG: outer membrane protein assembly factor BamE (lipoprotein component of BamABCDE complex) [Alphaproteobacteria bacterium]|jgi:outer membrane protein assembly factor BamE (lipoprotein component of BamABCDE complex)
MKCFVSMKKVILSLLVTLFLTACSPIRSQHGFNNMALMRSWVKENTVLKPELQARFGPASFIDTEGEITSLYYVSFTKERFAFFKPTITERNILAVHFKDNVYQESAEYKLEDGKDIRLVSDITPIYGKKMTVIQQILSNVGRFNNVPGQGRGRSDGSVLGPIPGGI